MLKAFGGFLGLQWFEIDDLHVDFVGVLRRIVLSIPVFENLIQWLGEFRGASMNLQFKYV